MALRLVQNDERFEIHLDGAVNIAAAAELKGYLMEALPSGLPLSIFLDQAAELDVCIVQLLFAAARAWPQAGQALHLVGPLREEVRAAVSGAGFPPLEVTQDACLAGEVQS